MSMDLRVEHSGTNLLRGHVYGYMSSALFASVTIAAAVWLLLNPAVATVDATDAADLRQALVSALGPGHSDTSERLIRVAMPFNGDAGVEFLARDQGSAQANRMAALTDALAIARAVYEQPVRRPLNLTIIGRAKGPWAGADPVAVVYVSAPSDRLVGLNWSRVRPENLPELASLRWLPNGLCVAWQAC